MDDFENNREINDTESINFEENTQLNPEESESVSENPQNNEAPKAEASNKAEADANDSDFEGSENGDDDSESESIAQDESCDDDSDGNSDDDSNDAETASPDYDLEVLELCEDADVDSIKKPKGKKSRLKRSQSKPPKEKSKKSAVTTIILIILFILLIIAIAFAAKKFFSSRNPQINNPSVSTTVPETTTTSMPENYELLTLSQNDIGKGELVLVNFNNKYKYISDSELFSLYSIRSNFMMSNSSHCLTVNAAYAVRDWLDAFYAETGSLTVNVISTYRSYSDQQKLLDYYTELYESEEEARKWTALPGKSEHHTGLAVDLQVYNSATGVAQQFTGEGIYSWLNENAYQYGFILRYPEDKSAITGISHETWHFRYIGVPHATAMKQLNISCYESYIEIIKNYTLDTEPLTIETSDGNSYEIYYVNGTDIPVPTDRSYTYSGNNVDGFIVTVSNQ